MKISQLELCYIPYAQLRENKEIPQSFAAWFGWLFRSIWRGIKKGFPKNVLVLFVFMLLYFVGNTFYMAFIQNSMYLAYEDANQSFLPYIFSCIVMQGINFKGFDIFVTDMKTIYWTIPMLFLLTNLILSIRGRIRKQGLKTFFSEIKDTIQLAKLYSRVSAKSLGNHILLGCFWGCIIGFFLQSPIILFLLPLSLLLSFTLKDKSKIIGVITMYRISRTINKEKPEYVNIADIALTVLGLAVGFAAYFIVAMLSWVIFDYSILSRILFTAICAGIFFALYKIKKSGKTIQPANLLLIIIAILINLGMLALKVYADDGGWSESDKNITMWLGNPGTSILAKLGIGGDVGTALGWIADMMTSGIPAALGLGEVFTLTQVAAGAGDPPLDQGIAAYEIALSPVGPLGDWVTDRVDEINDAMSGSDSGSSGHGPESGSSSGGPGSHNHKMSDYNGDPK